MLQVLCEKINDNTLTKVDIGLEFKIITIVYEDQIKSMLSARIFSETGH